MFAALRSFSAHTWSRLHVCAAAVKSTTFDAPAGKAANRAYAHRLSATVFGFDKTMNAAAAALDIAVQS